MTSEDFGGDQDAVADERDRVADERDAVADERDSAWIEWQIRSEVIGAEAKIRDQRAEDRDADAHRRDMQANLAALITGRNDDEAFAARRTARDDRDHAKGNRVASGLDRYLLTSLVPSPAKRRAAADDRSAAADDRRHAADSRNEKPASSRTPSEADRIANEEPDAT